MMKPRMRNGSLMISQVTFAVQPINAVLVTMYSHQRILLVEKAGLVIVASRVVKDSEALLLTGEQVEVVHPRTRFVYWWYGDYRNSCNQHEQQRQHVGHRGHHRPRP